MSSCSKRSILTHWRWTLSVTIACVAWWSFTPSAPAQESESPILVASLSVSTVQPEFILNSVRERSDQWALRPVERDYWPITVPRHKRTEAEAWGKFESEFRPKQWNPSPVMRQIEIAKYGLDTTLFAVDRFVKAIRDHVDFEFDQGRLHRTVANTPEGFLDKPRVKLDLDLTHGKPYIGGRIVVPFGN